MVGPRRVPPPRRIGGFGAVISGTDIHRKLPWEGPAGSRFLPVKTGFETASGRGNVLRTTVLLLLLPVLPFAT